MLYKILEVDGKEIRVYDTNKLPFEVLFVDTNVDTEEVMRRLRQEGEYITAARPDLIVVDLSLPRKEGAQALAKIKQISSLQDIPIVILTASEIQSTIFKTYGVSADAYLSKPFDTDRFDMLVNSLV